MPFAGAASVAVAVVVASKDEEGRDELLLLLVLAQALDQTGGLFMSLRLHGLIVALLSSSPASAASVASISRAVTSSHVTVDDGLIVALVHILRDGRRLYLPSCFCG